MTPEEEQTYYEMIYSGKMTLDQYIEMVREKHPELEARILVILYEQWKDIKEGRMPIERD